MASALVPLGALLALGPTACSGAAPADLRALDPAIGANPGSSAALYVDLVNDGDGDDALVDASCDCADRTSLHVTEDHDGILLMVAADDLELPAGSRLELHPGGPHIMLEGLRRPLEAGSTLQVRLEFSRSAPLDVEVPVVALADLAERVPRR